MKCSPLVHFLGRTYIIVCLLSSTLADRVCLASVSSLALPLSMALAIDTTHIAQQFIPRVQRFLDFIAGDARRYQVHRVCAHATVVFDDSTFWSSLDSARCFRDIVAREGLRGWQAAALDWKRIVAKQDAMDWKADPEDDLNELEVLHHLQQQAATSPSFLGVFSQKDLNTNAATTLFASAVSPSLGLDGRLLSLRCSKLCHPVYYDAYERPVSVSEIEHNSTSRALFNAENYSRRPILRAVPPPYDLKIVWASSKRRSSYVFWQVQVDVVDLSSPRAHPTSRPGKRRRTAFNHFLQVANSAVVEDTSPGDHLPPAKRFKGVRYRADRRTWVAEMKPPKQNKQDFGNFKSEAQAARAVDAAFHHYGKPYLLNFPDISPQILSARPAAAAGLDEKGKLRFVKEEAKWLASIAAYSPLPSSVPPLPATLSAPHPSSNISLSVISCDVGADEEDDGVSHSQPVTSTEMETMEPNYVRTEELGVVGTLQEGQSLIICSSENVIADPCLHPLRSGTSSAEITEQGWDSVEDSILATLPNVVIPRACENQSMWLDSLLWSPPAPLYPMAPSPRHFQDDIARALLEL